MMTPVPEGYRRTPFGLVPVGKDFSVAVALADGSDAMVTASVILTPGGRIVEDYRVKLASGEDVEDFDESAYPHLEDDLACKAEDYYRDRG